MSYLDNLLILFATQTGNAESIAELFVTEDISSFIKTPRVLSFQAYAKLDPDLSQFAKERLVLLLVSTTGQGDVPDKALPLMRLFKRKERAIVNCKDGSIDPKPFQGVQLISLGLGDSNYDKYNNGIKTVEKSLHFLGCTNVVKTSLADDGIGLELGVEAWRKSTRELLKRLYDESLQVGSNPTGDGDSTTTNPDEALPQGEDAACEEESHPPVVLLPPPRPANCPAPVNKPSFLLKAQAHKLSTLLISNKDYMNHYRSILRKAKSDLQANKASAATQVGHPTDVIESDKFLPLLQVQPVQDTPYSTLHVQRSSQGRDLHRFLIGQSSVLAEYIYACNLQSFILEHSTNPNSKEHDQALTLLSSLVTNDYGMTAEIPLFGELNTSYAVSLEQSQLRNYPGVKHVLEANIKLAPDAAQLLGLVKQKRIEQQIADGCLSFEQSDDPFFVQPYTFDIENGAITNHAVDTPQQPSPSDTASKVGTANKAAQINIIPLYEPGDCVSLLCPNHPSIVSNVLHHMQLEQYSHHGVLLTEPESASSSSSGSGSGVPSDSNTSNASTGADSAGGASDTHTHTHAHPLTTANPICLYDPSITHPHLQQTHRHIITGLLQEAHTAVELLGAQDITTQVEPPASNGEVTPTMVLGDVLVDPRNIARKPINYTVYDMISRSIELSNPVKKVLLRHLGEMTTEPSVGERLLECMSRDGRPKLKKYIEDQQITLPELLDLFVCPTPSTQSINGSDSSASTTTATSSGPRSAIVPTLASILDFAGSLKPRAYSLSTSPLQHIYSFERSDASSESDVYSFTSPRNFIDHLVGNKSSDSPGEHGNPQTPGGDSTTSQKLFIAGSQVRFAATIVNEPLSPVEMIPPATYPEATSSETSEASGTEFKLPHHLTTDRAVHGVCTTWLNRLHQEVNTLRCLRFDSKDAFYSYVVKNYCAYGCVVEKPTDNFTDNSDVIVHIPFFFHPSPDFRLPPQAAATANTTTTNPQVVTTPDEKQTPSMILIGPGTGSSPFLSFIQHKRQLALFNTSITAASAGPDQHYIPVHHMKRMKMPQWDDQEAIHHFYNNLSARLADHDPIVYLDSQPGSEQHAAALKSTNIGSFSLFTGNRYREVDYLYGMEFASLVNAGYLDHVTSVFSRQGKEPSQVRYVQDVLQLQGDALVEHILGHGWVYICGDGVSMSRGVQKTIEAALADYASKHSESDIKYTLPPSSQHRNAQPVSKQLEEYITRPLSSFTTPAEREAWARGIIGYMVKIGHYTTDVWS